MFQSIIAFALSLGLGRKVHYSKYGLAHYTDDNALWAKYSAANIAFKIGILWDKFFKRDDDEESEDEGYEAGKRAWKSWGLPPELKKRKVKDYEFCYTKNQIENLDYTLRGDLKTLMKTVTDDYRKYRPISAVIVVILLNENMFHSAMIMMKDMESEGINRPETDFYEMANAFNQGTRTEVIESLLRRMSNMIDWGHPQIRKNVEEVVIGEILEKRTT